jgi:hypothetical protein
MEHPSNYEDTEAIQVSATFYSFMKVLRQFVVLENTEIFGVSNTIKLSVFSIDFHV